VSIAHEGRELRLLGAHPNRPGRGDQTGRRNRTLARLAALAAEQADVVVLGDLNVTEGSPHFGRLIATARLADTRAGRGRMGTWRVRMPRTGWQLPLRLPIDHVLVGASLATAGRRLGPELGSDHLPVLADVGWR
jgi:endonuclease/exonuclease/phosphatase family metal-dependent hydrolase